MPKRRRLRRAKVSVVKAPRRSKAATRVIVQRVRAPRVRRVAPVIQRVAAPIRRIVTYGKAQRHMSKLGGIDLKAAVRSTVISSTGGMAGALIESVLAISDTTKDWGTAAHAAAQVGVGIAAKYVFGNSKTIGDFVSGMNGQAAGAALNKFGLQTAVKAIRTLK